MGLLVGIGSALYSCGLMSKWKKIPAGTPESEAAERQHRFDELVRHTQIEPTLDNWQSIAFAIAGKLKEMQVAIKPVRKPVKVHLQRNATAEHAAYSREVRALIKVARIYHDVPGNSVTSAFEEAGLSGSAFYRYQRNNKSLWEAMKSGGEHIDSFLDFLDFDLNTTDPGDEE